MADHQSLTPIRCKAAVCRANGAPLVIEEISVDPPKAYEIRIKIICTSLCHTDLTFWRAKEDFAIPPVFPRILGHEAYGVVESIGEHAEEFAVGDTVVPTFLGQCDSCSSCASEGNNMCSAVPFAVGPGMRRDGTTRFRDGQGDPLHDFLAVSSFSQYTVVDVNQVVKVDPAVSPKLACLLGCGAGTGVGAAWKLAKVEPGSSVVIFGLGAVGLAVAQGAKMCGATKIVGVDLNPDKEKLGKMFGVTDFVNPSELVESSVTEVITKMTDGGADYCFECIGVATVMADAFRCTKQGKGKTVILGVEQDGKPICLPSIEFLFGKCIMGSLFGGIKPKTDIPILAEKCMNKELELEKLITHEVGLQEINTAFDLLVQGKSLRCIIWMDKLVV
uniref:Uncharacterized protein n=1 Tax=Avena sativa TaxID=4498 RepID=A0ACD5TUS2_AVESA